MRISSQEDVAAATASIYVREILSGNADNAVFDFTSAPQ